MNNLEALIACLYTEFARGPLAQNENADAIVNKLFEIMKEKYPNEMSEAFAFGRNNPSGDPAMTRAIDEVLDKIEIGKSTMQVNEAYELWKESLPSCDNDLDNPIVGKEYATPNESFNAGWDAAIRTINVSNLSTAEEATKKS